MQQRELLNNSSAELQESSYVFTASDGGLYRLDSLKMRFSKLRDQVSIPKDFRTIYCLRDTVASMILSNGATLAEVAHLLGHAPVALPRKIGLVVKRFGGVFPQIHFHTVVVSSNHCSSAYATGHSESQCIQTLLFVTPAHSETNGLRSLWPSDG